MKEIWKDIEGYVGIYQVSNIGRVRNNKGLIKSNRPCANGYLKTSLNKSAVRKTMLLHRIVAQAFLDNPDGLPQVNHKNGIKTDNRVKNLEWCTQKQNAEHAVKLGLVKLGEKNVLAKHTREQIIEVIELYNKGVPRKEIVRITGLKEHIVKSVRSKKRWKHLSHLLKV